MDVDRTSQLPLFTFLTVRKPLYYMLATTGCSAVCMNIELKVRDIGRDFP